MIRWQSKIISDDRNIGLGIVRWYDGYVNGNRRFAIHSIPASRTGPRWIHSKAYCVVTDTENGDSETVGKLQEAKRWCRERL